MTIEEIHIDDLGTTFRATIKEGAAVVNLATATALDIQFTSPGGIKTTKTAILTTDGSDGDLEYVRQAGDITRTGRWSYIGIATFSATEKYHSIEPTLFDVVD